jgi:predicted amidohydrolase
MKIAGAQLGSVWENPRMSLKKAEPYIRKAADLGASLICFPEQYPTGWDPRSVQHVQDRAGLIVSLFRDLAQEYGIAILGSFRERFQPKPRNTCIVFNRDGEEVVSYSKCHLFTPADEDRMFSPGDKPGIFRFEGVLFGIAICYDLRFSGFFNVYAEAGISCMLVPAAWPAVRISHWELFIRTRALEHQCYVIGVNTTGVNPVDAYCGTSLAADPSGAVIARAGLEEELIIAGIEPDTVYRMREALPVSQDRKPDLYNRMRAGTGGS